MNVRPAVFAMQGWYPLDAEECRATLEQYRQSFPGRPTGRCAGVVPHAGWAFSGRLAAWTFTALAAAEPEVVFLFGGHMLPGQRPVCMPEGAWGTPLGEVPVEAELAGALVERFDCRRETAERFEPDNTIELQLPMLKFTWPQARVVAVQVPPEQQAMQMGAWAAEQAEQRGLRAVAIGSTDLTHYGPHYGFTPKGSGAEALRWAKEDNDRPLIALLEKLDIDAAVEHALRQHSACCPGAAGAAAHFARACGAERGRLIEHTTSHDIAPRGEPQMWVGYAGIVY